MENWPPQTPPLVSIVCTAYNHEAYISEAIEGFLKQETDFPFEIIIHDDASTDRTAEIIKQYAKNYPAIIRPIFQIENQLSQYRKNPLQIAISHSNATYIACCDGDDYWIDASKLKIQITEMRKYPDCQISFHPILRKCNRENKSEKILSQHAHTNKIFHTKEVILGEGSFCQTSSCVIKNNIFKTIPKWFSDVPIGDFFLQTLASLQGGALYINKVMSVYRSVSVGSWSERMAKDEEYAYNYLVKILKSIDDINSHTHNQYYKEFNIIKKKVCFYMCRNPLLSGSRRYEIFNGHKDKFNFKNRVMWNLIYKNNVICKWLYGIRNYILN